MFVCCDVLKFEKPPSNPWRWLWNETFTLYGQHLPLSNRGSTNVLSLFGSPSIHTISSNSKNSALNPGDGFETKLLRFLEKNIFFSLSNTLGMHVIPLLSWPKLMHKSTFTQRSFMAIFEKFSSKPWKWLWNETLTPCKQKFSPSNATGRHVLSRSSWRQFIPKGRFTLRAFVPKILH